MDPLQALLNQGALKPDIFPPNSRYHGIDTATWETSDGKTVVYVLRRFIPSADRFVVLHEYTVVEGDRLDNIAAQVLGDPERFWQICDANNAMLPEKLTEVVGRALRITLPQDVPGVPHA